MRTPLQIVADHYAASARHDLDAMLADLAADVCWTESAGAPTAGTFVGREQIVEHVFKPIGAAWHGFGFELERLIDGGGTIVAIGRYVGTHRATGKALDARVAHVWQVDAGQVLAFEQFADTVMLARPTA